MTRTTTVYDKRPDGWRFVETKEVPVESTHSCDRDSLRKHGPKKFKRPGKPS